MTVEFEITPERIFATKNGEAVFDTDAFPVQLFGVDTEISLTGQTLTWPDPPKGDAYNYGRGNIDGDLHTGCASYITIGNQEWQQDTVVGTVPAGTDFLMVRFNLTRTGAPSQILSKTIPVAFDQGKWVTAPGGGILIEALAPIVRILKFFINGSNQVVMRRIQSVTNKSYTFWRGDNNPALSGWTHGGTAGRKGHIVFGPIQVQGPTWDISGALHARGSGTQCSLADPTNYGSTYTGDIIITPGVTRLDTVVTGGSGSGRFFTHNGNAWADNASSVSATIDLGVEAEDRLIVVVPSGGRSGGSSSQYVITGVTLNGAAMTQRVQTNQYVPASGSGHSSGGIGIYTKRVPAGETATIVASASGPWTGFGFDVYSLYGVANEVPESVSATNIGNATGTVSASVSTTSGSIVIGGASTYSNTSSALSMSGIDNIVIEPFHSFTSVMGGRAYQYGTGGTKTLNASSMRHSVALASFF